MSHPIIRALGDYLQLSSAQGVLRALRLEPRRTILSRTLSSLKLLGTGIVIGRDIDMYAETLLDYAKRSRRRSVPRALATAGTLAVGVGIGVGAAIWLVPELRAGLWRGPKSQSASPSSSVSSPASSTAAAGVKAASTNGGAG